MISEWTLLLMDYYFLLIYFDIVDNCVMMLIMEYWWFDDQCLCEFLNVEYYIWMIYVIKIMIMKICNDWWIELWFICYLWYLWWCYV